MTPTQVEQQLNILQDGIRIDAPLVADFFDVTTPLQQYTQEINEYVASPQHRERQESVKQAVRKILQRTFSEAEIDQANILWEEDWKLNIVDHHNVLNHPILMSTNIIANMFQLPSGQPRGIIVLSDSGVPMNNFFHKRGVRFHGKQLNFIPTKDRHVMYYGGKARTTFPLTQAAKQQGCSEQEVAFLTNIEKQWEQTATDSRITTYNDQVKRINYQMWKQLFSEDIRVHIPDLFYVPNEELGVELLNEFLQNSNHLFSKILCDQPTREIFIKEFSEVTGCWDADGRRGSLFFWGLSQSGEAFPLWIDGNDLVSRDPAHILRIPLQSNELIQALADRTIYPGMFLVYGMADFYCGVRPLVGFGSMNYQTKMKEAWIRTMQQVDPAEVLLLESISTTGFIGGPKVTFRYQAEKGFEDMFALDIISAGGLTREYLDHLRTMPFNTLLQPSLIDIYDSYVRPERKQPITVMSNDLMGASFEWLKTMQV